MVSVFPLATFSAQDLIIIAIVGLLIFGKRLPEVGKSIGQAIVGFKKGLKEAGEEIKDVAEPEANSASAPQPKPPAVRASTVQKPKKALRPASEEP